MKGQSRLGQFLKKRDLSNSHCRKGPDQGAIYEDASNQRHAENIKVGQSPNRNRKTI